MLEAEFHLIPLQEIDLLVWAQKRCRRAFGSSIADNMMCVSKKKKPIDATCNVGEPLISHVMLFFPLTEK